MLSIKRVIIVAVVILYAVTPHIVEAKSGVEEVVVVARGDELVRIDMQRDSTEMQGVSSAIDPVEYKRVADRELHRQNRGLIQMSDVFVPKGQWIAGATGSYSTHENDNYTFTLIEDIDSEGYTIKASPFVLYAYKDNTAVGGRLQYGRSLTRIYDASFSIGSEDDGIEIGVNNYYALTNSYTAMVVLRQYIPFGGVKRFSFYTDIMLEGGAFQSKFAHDIPVHGTFSQGYTCGLGITPGLVAVATNDIAFEVSIAVAGLEFTHTEQVHNQVYYGSADAASMSFKLNILSVGFGVSFYL